MRVEQGSMLAEIDNGSNTERVKETEWYEYYFDETHSR